MKYERNEINKMKKIQKFDVVELNDNNRATILEIKGNNEYLAEIVNAYGVTVDNKIITNEDISKVVFQKEYVR